MQIFNIFRKDAMHLWPEILVSCLVLAAFGWVESLTWQKNADNAVLIAIGAGVLRFLIPITWLLVTSRLVHDEELVGDRQFWITRPYTWYNLLLSKMLSIFVFLCVPFLLMQMILLKHAGLYPMLSLPALLQNMMYVAGFALLLMLAIAAATATFIRYASSVLVGFLYALAVLGFVAYKWPDNFAAPYMDYPLNTVILGLIAAALFFSYARRKTLIARVLLIAIPVAVVLVLSLAPINALISHRYPEASLGQVQFVSGEEYQQNAGKIAEHAHAMVLDLPLQAQLTGLPDKAFAAIQVVRATIDGPSGYHFDTGWEPTQGALVPGEGISGLGVRLPEKVFNEVHTQPVAMHISIGVQVYQPATPYTVTATEKPFPLPGHAMCMIPASDGMTPQSGVLECRYPLRNEFVTHADAVVHEGPCSTPGLRTAPASGTIEIATGLFDPVGIVETPFSIGGGKQPVKLCPGTSVTFTQSKPAQYARMHFDIPAITLDSYAMRIRQ